MKFERKPRYEPFTWSERKQQAFLNKPAREQKKNQVKYPLFADQLETPAARSLQDEIELRLAQAASSEMTMRNFHARVWREARSQYFACTPEIRGVIRQAWNEWRGPLTSTYFIYVVELHNGVAEARNIAIKQKDELLRKIVAAKLYQGEQLPF